MPALRPRALCLVARGPSAFYQGSNRRAKRRGDDDEDRLSRKRSNRGGDAGCGSGRGGGIHHHPAGQGGQPHAGPDLGQDRSLLRHRHLAEGHLRDHGGQWRQRSAPTGCSTATTTRSWWRRRLIPTPTPSPASTILYHGTLAVEPLDRGRQTKIVYTLFYDQAPLGTDQAKAENRGTAHQALQRGAGCHEGDGGSLP